MSPIVFPQDVRDCVEQIQTLDAKSIEKSELQIRQDVSWSFVYLSNPSYMMDLACK